MSLNGVEVIAKITGAGAKGIATYLFAAMKSSKQTKGKSRISSMLKSGKELKIFAIKEEDLEKFTREAKRYGVLYCVIKQKGSGVCDIMARAEDASKINRIMEVFNLSAVDEATINTEIAKDKSKSDMEAPDIGVIQKDELSKTIDEILDPAVNKEQAVNQNPTTQDEPFFQTAREKSPQSERSSKFNEEIKEGPDRSSSGKKSVSEKLKEIKKELEAPEPQKRKAPKQTEHSQPKTKKKAKSPKPKNQIIER